MITQLTFPPLSFLLHEGINPKATAADGKITQFCPKASAAGMQTGMDITLARIQHPELQVYPERSVETARLWGTLLQDLYLYAECIEPLQEGQVLLVVRESDAKQLAHAHQAQAGRASTRELAQLASHLARPGEVLQVKDTEAFLQQAPTAALTAVGVKPATIERLHWLGMRTVSDLQKWTRSQVQHYFGDEAKGVLRLLFEKHSWVARFELPTTVTKTFTFDEDTQDMAEITSVLHLLSEHLLAALGKLQPRKVTVAARTVGGDVFARRLLKEPLTDVKSLKRIMLLTLLDTHTLPLGIHRIQVDLTDLYLPAGQEGLFPKRPSLQQAAHRVEERYPGSTFHYSLQDSYTQARDLKYQKKKF